MPNKTYSVGLLNKMYYAIMYINITHKLSNLVLNRRVGAIKYACMNTHTHTYTQGGVTPVASVLPPATAVKLGQDGKWPLTFDFP